MFKNMGNYDDDENHHTKSHQPDVMTHHFSVSFIILFIACFYIVYIIQKILTFKRVNLGIFINMTLKIFKQ